MDEKLGRIRNEESIKFTYKGRLNGIVVNPKLRSYR